MRKTLRIISLLLLSVLLLTLVGCNESSNNSQPPVLDDDPVVTSNKLDTPVVTLNGNVATWDEISEAKNYTIYINGVAKPVKNTSRTYNLSDGDTLEVVANPKGSSTKDESSKSNAVTYTKPSVAIPELKINYKTGEVTWEAVSKARAYVITLNGIEQSQQTTRTFTLDDGDIISIRAISNDNNYKDSLDSDPITFHEEEVLTPFY